MTDLITKIKKVTALQALPGFEAPVRDYLRQKINPYVDRIETDGLGGLFGIREHQDQTAPRILIAGHMDEVGFMIKEIKTDGTFRAIPLGGWNPLVVSSQRFCLKTHSGHSYPVISGSTPPHFLKNKGQTNLPQIEDIIFDGGFSDQKEAEHYGIALGDIIIPDSQATITANRKNMISKAWDNRYGILMVTELLKALAKQPLGHHLIAGANVQEEVGLRGAHASTTLFNPDLFFAVDCSPAGDIYGQTGEIGKGTLLRFYDPGHILLPNLKDFLLTTAEEAGITYQYYCGAGGTDAGAAHLKRAGIPSTTIGVCARYIHSHQSLYALDDFLEAQAFLQAIIKKLDRTTVDLITAY